MDKLANLIIRRIIANVGAVPNHFGKGLTDPALILDKKIKIKYDDKVREHNIFAGSIHFTDNQVLQGLLIDLTIDIPDYLFLFKLNNNVIHAAKALYDENDTVETFLRVKNEKKWVETNLCLKAQVLVQFELIVSWGYLWNEAKADELYESAVELLKN